ncbi:hypothetical protein K7A41_16020 [Sphingobacterium sp. InxBP1]|uniref:hypothetical protein n=1 Tax=Sphingobacterium sp. InxBP1 TaxID=2870328 RepID=UPI00224361BA|nr:hypothetical protein [Sphingobacterium sp. InxBP1]MCW8312738.1 hypothetical protein [Sphingobacterium sp. InxBP1]
MKENSTYHDGLEPTNLPESLRKNPFGVPENYFEDLESKIIAHVSLGKCSEEGVFEVPEGYFDSLPDRIMGEIAMDSIASIAAINDFDIPEHYEAVLTDSIFHRIAEEKLKEKIQSDGFKVPVNYEHALEDDIFARITAEELKNTVPTDGFTIPADYMQALEGSIFARIATEKLKNSISTDGYTVPGDYEQTLEDNIFARIAVDQLKQKVPNDGFEVPPHYFERLSDTIVDTIRHNDDVVLPETPIRRLGRPKKWYARYAVAASLAMTLGLGGYWGYQYQSQNTISADNTAEQQLSQHLSEIPKQEIINYLAASASGDDMIYMSQYTDETNLPTKGFGTNVSKQDIEDYLNYSL